MLNKSLEKIYIEDTIYQEDFFHLSVLIKQLGEKGIELEKVCIEVESSYDQYDESCNCFIKVTYKRLETDKEYSKRMKEIKAEETLLKRQKERHKEQGTKREADRKKLYEKLKKEFEGCK
jgi:hypothetical protein